MNPEEAQSSAIQASEGKDVVPVEIMDEAAYAEQLQRNEQLAQQDAQARERARRILKQCQEGFVPNLIHGPRMLPYDGIFASKAILKLLELSLAEDHNCEPGAAERQAFSRANTYNSARHCGKKLNFIGGETLMAYTLNEWIPAFDQPNLSETWTGIGNWSGQYKMTSSNQTG